MAALVARRTAGLNYPMLDDGGPAHKHSGEGMSAMMMGLGAQGGGKRVEGSMPKSRRVLNKYPKGLSNLHSTAQISLVGAGRAQYLGYICINRLVNQRHSQLLS
jgi:hypothetical protein